MDIIRKTDAVGSITVSGSSFIINQIITKEAAIDRTKDTHAANTPTNIFNHFGRTVISRSGAFSAFGCALAYNSIVDKLFSEGYNSKV